MLEEVLASHNSLSEAKFKELAKKVGLNVSQFFRIEVLNNHYFDG
jgi:hypothetical protein